MNCSAHETRLSFLCRVASRPTPKRRCRSHLGMFRILIIMRQQDSSDLSSDFLYAAPRNVHPYHGSTCVVSNAHQINSPSIQTATNRDAVAPGAIRTCCARPSRMPRRIRLGLESRRCVARRLAGQIRWPWHRSPSPMCPLPQIASSETSRGPSCRFSHP